LKQIDKLTAGTLFSGGGGYDSGAIMAGFTPIWAVEYEPKIAEVYIDNYGEHMTVANILDLDPRDFARVDLFHASPPCPNFSVAKAGGTETELDKALSLKVSEFIKVLTPNFVTIENVRAYEKSDSWELIYNTLKTLGYSVNWWILNSANYGVAQARERMIVMARKDGKNVKQPISTHEKNPGPLFGLPKWKGWYSVIEDLVHSFPVAYRGRKLPCSFHKDYVAEIIENDVVVQEEQGPECRNTPECRGHFAPWQLKRLPKTLIPRTVAIRDFNSDFVETDVPYPTLMTGHMDKVYLVDGGNAGGTRQIHRDGKLPSSTITTAEHRRVVFPDITKQHEGLQHIGIIVKLTIPALARIQSFPDSYKFPDSQSVACRIIGNSVPPLLAKAICLTFID
jgi:DNA (cytosine-5)-methyltransferase 1